MKTVKNALKNCQIILLSTKKRNFEVIASLRVTVPLRD